MRTATIKPSGKVDALIAEKVIGVASQRPASYTRDLSAAWEVEEVIRRKGLEAQYEDALWAVIGDTFGHPAGATVAISNWPIIHASAAERCVAALRVFGVNYQSETGE